MKLYKTDLGGIGTGFYGAVNMRFTMCKKPDKKKYVARLFPFQGCREELTMRVRKLLASRDKKLLDPNRTRLLFYFRTATPPGTHYPVPHKGLNLFRRKRMNKIRKEAHDKMMVGLKLVNRLEKEHGWLPTKFYKVDDGGDASLFVYMVVGSPRWQKTPHYLSLYTLLIRAGTNENFNPASWDEKSFQAAMNNRVKYGGHFAFVAKHFFDKVPFFLANQDKIVENNNILKTYQRKRYVSANNGFNEGIFALLSGNSYDRDLSVRMKELYDKAGIKHTINNEAVKRAIAMTDMKNEVKVIYAVD